MGTSLTGINNSDPAVTFTESNGFDSLTTDDFVQLLITQLSNQNPLEPLEDNKLLEQISSIQSLSTTDQLVETLTAFGLNQNLGAASSLIGREISAVVGDVEVAGTVNRAVVEDGQVYLLVGDDNVRVPFDSIKSVGDSTTVTDTLTPPSGGDDDEQEAPAGASSTG